MATRVITCVGAAHLPPGCAPCHRRSMLHHRWCTLPHRVCTRRHGDTRICTGMRVTPAGCAPLCRVGARYRRCGRCATGSTCHFAEMCATPQGCAPLCQDEREATGCARHAIWHVASMLCTKCRKEKGKPERRSRSNQRRRTAERSGSAGLSNSRIR